MMQVATSFLQGQEAASNQERKKAPPSWKHQEGGHRQNFKKGGGFRSQHKQEKSPDRFTLLTKTLREILALKKAKFKTPPPMTTPVEKWNANKFCEFHGEVGHNTDECNHLRRQIEDMLKAGKLSHIIKELKQNSAKDQKKKGETSGKEEPQEILIIQSWRRRSPDNRSGDRRPPSAPHIPTDMTGVPRHIAEHRLNVREGCQPIRQKKRGQAAERNIAINDEVSKLVAAEIMREVHYHDWLSNPVMVKKHDDSWRMCVDFKDLNKACPKDGYPLPEID
ncbi:hypothetical protein Tco_0548970 [Tanacetum coccineum]